MSGWRWKRGRRGRGRPMKPRWIGQFPPVQYFAPTPHAQVKPPTGSSVTLMPDEYEVIRLVDLEGLSQEKAGERMRISRGTVWRTLKRARRKVAKALAEGKGISITQPTPEQPPEKK